LQVPEIPVFHPVWQRNPAAWFPGDEAASLLVAGEHIWDDIKSDGIVIVYLKMQTLPVKNLSEATSESK
jgi:hypothetical protein